MRNAVVLKRRTSLLARLAAFLTEEGKEYHRQVRMERAIRHLRELPDYLLTDIGLSRSEITSVVREGFKDSSCRPRV